MKVLVPHKVMSPYAVDSPVHVLFTFSRHNAVPTSFFISVTVLELLN